MSPIADIDCPQDWQRAGDAVARDGAVAVVLGGVDTGKSTLCRFLAHYCHTHGCNTALLDADLGQSWIGPPTTVGFALVDGPELPQRGDEPADMWFVGATSPHGHMLQTAVGVRKMADAARHAGADRIIVDTSGWINGPAARALKEAKIALLSPRHIIAIQARGETQHLTAPYANRADVVVHNVRVSRRARVRDVDRRRRHREEQFRDYFAGARQLALPLGQITLLGTGLLSGTAAPGHVRSYAEELLGIECSHAEMIADSLMLVCDHQPDPGAIEAVREHFPDEEIAVVALDAVRGVVLGLSDARERLLGIGLLADVDFKAGQLHVTTPVSAADGATTVTVGTLRLHRDFSQLGPVEARWP